ncbi:hypothetical protein LEP1GSC170_1262 [Leptospira interrogans serovar Bataviae str. HAI135]|nr:hypothetical protein LEP1GSC170_1262 [Leptospira interrogans serovar Bataviae str. HAI135]
MLEAYRLPEGSFGNTQVGTDIIVLRKIQLTLKITHWLSPENT